MDNFPIRKSVIEISDTIPSFVLESYPRFVEFIEDYIKHLEEDGNILDTLERVQGNLNPDVASDFYLNRILKELGIFNRGDDEIFHINKNLLIKFIKEYNSSRGCSESFKLFYKLLFNEDCDINYAKDRLFRLSSSDYIKRHYLFITCDSFVDHVKPYTTKAFSGNYIEGKNKRFSNYSSIDALEFVHITNSKTIAKIEIIKPDFPYEKSEKVYVTFNGVTYEEKVVVSKGIKVIYGGYGYKVGDRITIDGRGAAFVSHVTTGSYEEVKIISKGINYSRGDLIRVIKRKGSSGYGFIGMVDKVDEFGGVERVLITNPGYNYNEAKVRQSDLLVTSKSGGSNGVFEVSSKSIGTITKVRILDDIIEVPL